MFWFVFTEPLKGHDGITQESITRKLCVYLIDKFYPLLVDAPNDAAKLSIPVYSTGSTNRNHWWSDDLNEYKNKAIQTFQIWESADKPRSGPVFNIYKDAKYAYKIAIKNFRAEHEFSITNELHDALSKKNKDNFWKIWKAKFSTRNSSKPLTVSGLVEPGHIADAFSEYFGNICQPNSPVYNDLWREKFDEEISGYSGDVWFAE